MRLVLATAIYGAIACGATEGAETWQNHPIQGVLQQQHSVHFGQAPPAPEIPLHTLRTLSAGVAANEKECKAFPTALWLRVNGRNF